MLRELRLILALSFIAICTTVCGQDTIDIQLFRLFSFTDTQSQKEEKILASCANNTYAPGVIFRFDPSTCAGNTNPILISPSFDRSDPNLFPDPTMAQTGETILTPPYIYEAPNDERFYVHCGANFKDISTCVDFDPALLPSAVQAIPTLSTWGIIILSLMFSILFPLTLRKRIYLLN